MNIVGTLPRRVREIDTCWIPLSDGCRLAARVWLPEDAGDDPVPAILEYIPYRRRDATAIRDSGTHRYFAGHGYACLRVDLRGSGDSDGLLLDEYLLQEHDDAVEVIAWIAAQPWCTGKVGMMGISWGGFNALQVAARRPPALGAIVTVCSTDDRYADDTHYMGGCLLNGNLNWASTMFAFCSRPPDPEVVGERWREMWLERLGNIPLLVENWTRHQRRDAYWRHGSVCEDFGAIECPVYAVGGWADAYTNAIPRLLAGLDAPRKGLIGPWAHAYPHVAKPGPAIGFLQEALRWWDHWLKGRDTGVMDEPMLRAWMQESVPPAAHYDARPGRWVAEPEWPSADIETRSFAMNPGRLDDAPEPEAALALCSPQTTGAGGGAWCAYGYEGDMPTDQRDDDARSLVFDTPPLAERMEILGAPVVTLSLESDRRDAFVAARLLDVAPGGESTRVSYGLLNLTHRDGHARPEPLEPGRRYAVRVRLGDIAYAFPPGHRVRIAVSSAYWPTVWPSPEPVTLTVYAGASALALPVRPPRPDDDALAPFAPPEAAPAVGHALVRPGHRRRTLRRDPVAGETEVTAHKDRGAFRLEDIDLEIDGAGVETYRIKDGDPLSGRGESAWTFRLARGSWRVRTETRTVFTATADAFHVSATLDAYEADTRIFCRTWHVAIPRDHV